MLTWTANSNLQTALPTQLDHEVEIIASLTQAAGEAGIGLDRNAIANIYVSLKSKPLAILIGPKLIGKIALIRRLAQFLTESDYRQCQMMAGHPWSFEKSENVALFAEAQMRFNTDKLLSIVEDAWHPENAHRVFIACITRISPAELLSFFTEVALQIRNGQIMQLGDVHFSKSIPFPPNLFIIGTMDTVSFEWWDSDLLSETNIIQLAGSSAFTCPSEDGPVCLDAREFLSSCVRAKQAAYCRIHSILRRLRQPLRPLLMIDALLKAYNVPLSNLAIEDAIIYLANSWSRLGNGLFDPETPKNLAITLDLVILQILLPRAVDKLHHLGILREQLLGVLADQFPRSYAFVAAAGQG